MHRRRGGRSCPGRSPRLPHLRNRGRFPLEHPLAQELGVNLVFGGHYFTETFGVKALGLLLKDVYGLDYTFIDLPPSSYSH